MLADTSPVEVVDGSSICVSGFPAGVHLYGSLVGATTFRCRPRVVPVCAAGTFGRPTSLGKSNFLNMHVLLLGFVVFF